MRVCDPGSVRYAYWLRLEELPAWLPCFLDGLRLRPFALRGWRQRPLEWLNDPTRDGCFWTPANMSCSDFRAAITGAGGKLVPLADAAAPASRRTGGHATGADTLVARFYTQALADTVYQLYKPDFEAFGYAPLNISTLQAST